MSPMTETASPVRPRSDLDALARRFAEAGSVLVRDVIEPTLAARVRRVLEAHTAWALVTRLAGQHRSFDAMRMDAIDATTRQTFQRQVASEAHQGFQYLFERFPLYDHGRGGRLSHPVMLEAFELLRSTAFIELGRRLTGAADIQFADGQFTRYRSGHFLTDHDDAADDMRRVAAYVWYLTPDWRAAYGGQLQFLGDTGTVASVTLPGYNDMIVFAVPQPHLVTEVASFAPGPRLALTGWFRAESEPEPNSEFRPGSGP